MKDDARNRIHNAPKAHRDDLLDDGDKLDWLKIWLIVSGLVMVFIFLVIVALCSGCAATADAAPYKEWRQIEDMRSLQMVAIARGLQPEAASEIAISQARIDAVLDTATPVTIKAIPLVEKAISLASAATGGFDWLQIAQTLCGAAVSAMVGMKLGERKGERKIIRKNNEVLSHPTLDPAELLVARGLATREAFKAGDN